MIQHSRSVNLWTRIISNSLEPLLAGVESFVCASTRFMAELARDFVTESVGVSVRPREPCTFLKRVSLLRWAVIAKRFCATFHSIFKNLINYFMFS